MEKTDFSLRFPAEWETHQACWLAWPSHEELWAEDLVLAQEQFVAFCRAISWVPPQSHSSPNRPLEKLHVMTPFPRARSQAEKALAELPVEFYDIPFGDIWLRDTAPLFAENLKSELASVCFQFNGWGNKYRLEFDSQVADRIAQKMKETLGFSLLKQDWVLEGGSIDGDGQGTALTTRQCLLNSNRNPLLSQADIELALFTALGIKKLIWLEDGLLNDHTDGHVDNIARFVAPRTVICMEPRSLSDPNQETLLRIKADLACSTDANGEKLRVVSIPSPGLIRGQGGGPIPASYMNFYISNHTVIVPVYGSSHDAEAVETIASVFPDRRTVGLRADAILKGGGGSFHCISQQVPAGVYRDPDHPFM